MHFGITKHSNRSQQALQDSSQTQRGSSNNSSTAALNQAGGEDKAFEARGIQQQQPQAYTQARDDIPSYLPTNNGQDIESRAYQGSVDRPSRSQSHRYTAGYPPLRPPSPLGADPRRETVDDQALGDYQREYNPTSNSRPQPQQPPPEQKKSKSARFFGGFSSSKSGRSSEQSIPTPPDQQSGQHNSHNNLSGIGRRISKRHKDPPPAFQGQGQNETEKQQIPGWQSGQSSSESYLPSPHEAEEDDSGLDPYLIRQSDHQQLEASHGQLLAHHQQPTIRLAGGEQDTTVRIVDDSEHIHYQQGQQQPLHLLTHQQQWVGQQTPHSSLGSPIVQQHGEYQHQVQPSQYQTHSPNQIPTNLQFHSNQNPEVVSQLSHDSPSESLEDQRPSSVQSTTQTPNSAVTSTAQQQPDFPQRGQSLQGIRPIQPVSTMPPPPGQSANRRSTDAKQALQQDGRGPSGQPPTYSQQQSFDQNQRNVATSGNPLPPVPGQQPPANYRGSALQREYTTGGGDQGRSTPPLPVDRELSEMDKLVIKYKKVKGLYFERLAQVEQLQNTLANQRLSQSRTSLDDNEYATRFNRLDGAIKEIAFSIRKDWKTIPRWLMPYVNQDAQKVGTKEMTAVGRAAISRWIWEEIFMKCFHPALEPPLSAELKRIEQNIRFSTTSNTQEELDALISKVVQWKLATVEGLGYQLNSLDSLDAKARFTQLATTNLTAHLLNHLQDVAPEGIEGNATSIIELAVGIATHLPLESRDISITYPLPGDVVSQMMKVEAALPALENPQLDTAQDAESSSTSSDPKEQDNGQPDAGKGEGANKLSKKPDAKSKLSSLVAQQGNNGKKVSVSAVTTNEPGESKTKDGSQRIRFAGFMGVEVRGRQYLVNPPVWTIS